MPTPVFVLGKQRSGTTWLANQLCQHPSIAGVTHERHHGVHESAFFSGMIGRYGDLRSRSNFAEFVQVFGGSDYFRLTELPVSFLYSLWGLSYEEIFRAVMDRYAEQKGAQYWLEKSPGHTLLVDRLAAIYDDAVFVAVIREPISTIASTLSFKKVERTTAGRRSQIVRSAIGWALFERAILRFASGSNRVHVVHYEDMANDLLPVMSGICRFLEVDYCESLIARKFRPNSSFPSRATNVHHLSASERALIGRTVSLARRLPLRLLLRLRTLRWPSSRNALPPWFFALLPLEEDCARNSNQGAS